MVAESSRAGVAGSRVRSAVATAVESAELDPVDQALGAVAVTLAGQLDKLGRVPAKESPADRARRTADVVRVSRELRGLLRDLPLRSGTAPAPPEGAGSDDDDATAARPDDVDAELADLVGSGPTVGDATFA